MFTTALEKTHRVVPATATNPAVDNLMPKHKKFGAEGVASFAFLEQAKKDGIISY